ncbi:MAG: signal peptidase I [Ruminiclostridium sp.]|nr:signal peptidase I [Ruminiclostridium sp.]
MSETQNTAAPLPEDPQLPDGSNLPEGANQPDGNAAAPTPPTDEKKKKTDLATDLFTWLQALTMALVFLVVVFAFFARVINVDGESMVPTLHHRDLLFLQCINYEPEQGDIVVLRKSFAEIDSPIVKRVIAVGGQTVEIDYSTSTVYVDGVPLDEPYINEAMLMPSSDKERGTYWEVPQGSVFVMGDNRNASADSRNADLGTVDTRYILGRAVCVLLPFQDFRMLV